ncbi:MAG: ATP-binding protein [Bacilli bacterium]|nr:ATP-binding protein [Bacilli bacterium]
MNEFSFLQVWQYTNYMIELLLAEMVFLYAAPKRSKFPLRLSLSVIACLVLSYFAYQLIYDPNFLPGDQQTIIKGFLSLLILIAASIGAMYISFDLKPIAVFAGCAGGVGLQHIGYHLYRLVRLIGDLKNFDPTHGLELIVSVVLFIIAFFTIGQYVRKQKTYRNYNVRFIIISSVIIFICIGITRFYQRGFIDNNYYVIAGSLYAITCCSLSLFIMFYLYKYIEASANNKTLKQLYKEQKKQYEIRKENIDLLNIKFHDLKHQINHLENRIPEEEINKMKKSLDIYNGMYKTGIEGLDTILNEKSLSCIAKNISLTYMGNAKAIDFMKPYDIFSLFGNALDNAIEAVDKIENPSKRCISVVIENKGDLIYINIINYTKEKAIIHDGLPQTSKQKELGYHGFGVKSIKNIAEAYDGGIQVTYKEDIFLLSIYMLKPE